MHREEEKLNSRQPRSEGVRRIVAACSIGLSGLWIFLLGCLSLATFHSSRSGFELSIGLFITVIGGVVFYFIPKWMSKIVYYIKNGFDLEKNCDDTASEVPKPSPPQTVPKPSLTDSILRE